MTVSKGVEGSAQKVNKRVGGRIRTGSGSDRPKIQSEDVAYTPIDFSIRLRLQKLSIGPVATARGSDTVKDFCAKPELSV